MHRGGSRHGTISPSPARLDSFPLFLQRNSPVLQNNPKITQCFQPQLPIRAKPPGQEEAAQSPEHTRGCPWQEQSCGARLQPPPAPCHPSAAFRHGACPLHPATHPDPLLAGSSVTVLVTFSNNYSLPLPKPTLLKSQNAPVFLPTYANKKPLCRDPSPSPFPHGAEPRAAPSRTDPVTWAPTLQHRSPTSGHGPSSTGATAIPCRPALAPRSIACCRQPP